MLEKGTRKEKETTIKEKEGNRKHRITEKEQHKAK